MSLSLPVIDTVEPVSSIILGTAVFGERLPRSPGLLTLQLIGGAIAGAGIAVLSHSAVTLAEERRESQSASPQVGQAPEPADRLAGNKHHRSFRKILISRTYGGFQMQHRAVDERRVTQVPELIGGGSGLGWVAVKAVLLFAGAVIGLRLGEPRTLARLNAFDFAVAVTIGPADSLVVMPV